MTITAMALSLVLPFWEDKSTIRKPSRHHYSIERGVTRALQPLKLTVGGARPRKWCGWYMRQLKGVKDPSFNRARLWATYGTKVSGPTVGAIVVWRHHVGIITGRADNGRWLVHSGNDSNALRTRARSLKGAIAFRV